jgi:hypothetical protein
MRNKNTSPGDASDSSFRRQAHDPMGKTGIIWPGEKPTQNAQVRTVPSDDRRGRHLSDIAVSTPGG